MRPDAIRSMVTVAFGYAVAAALLIIDARYVEPAVHMYDRANGFLLPIGSAVVGFCAALGFMAAAKFAPRNLDAITTTSVLLGGIIFFLMFHELRYLQSGYRTGLVSFLNLEALNETVGFSLDRGPVSLPLFQTGPLGAWGYGLMGIQALGFFAGFCANLTDTPDLGLQSPADDQA